MVLATGMAGPALAADPSARSAPAHGSDREVQMKPILDALNAESGNKAVMLASEAGKDVIAVSTPEWPRVVLAIMRGENGRARMAKAMLVVPDVGYLTYEDYNRFNRQIGFGNASKLDDGAAELSVTFGLTNSEHDGRLCADAVGFVRIMLGSFVKLTNEKYPAK
jgi:hypothetical protein